MKKHIYTVYYTGIENGKIFDGVGSAVGVDEKEARKNFVADYADYCVKIDSMEIYK
jgi:hypothetical protein